MALTIRTTRNDFTLTREQGKALRTIQASLAKSVLKREQRRGTFPKKKSDYLRVVDRKLGMPEEAVRFGGRISYQNNTSTLAEILQWIGAQLVKYSPYTPKPAYAKNTGDWRGSHYADAHLMLINGKSFQTIDKHTRIVGLAQTFQGRKHSRNSRYTFINTLPYARRIEHGSDKTKPWTQQAPTGVYKMVASAAKRKYGEAVNIKYTRFQIGSIPYKFKAKEGMVGQWYPAIVVRDKAVTKGVDPT